MAIGWALNGPGRHAARSVAPAMAKAADTRLAAVISRDAARGAAFAREHGFAKVHASLADALGDRDIDAIYDTTPDALHAPNAIACAAAGKHMLLDKPLATSVADGARALAAYRSAGVTLGVVFNQRHDAVHQAARAMVADGAIGEVVLARAQLALPRRAGGPAPGGGNWRADPAMRPGGVASSIGDHAFDTLAWVLGQDIETVCAMTDAAPDAPAERTAALMLHLSGGAMGHVAASYALPFAQRPLEIHGADGSLILHNSFAYLVGAASDPRPAIEIVTAAGRELRPFPPTDCFRLEIERFNRAIAGEAAPMTPPVDGLRALAVTEAIYAATRDGAAARVADFLPAET